MRPTFGREYIENEFRRIGEGLSEPLTVYIRAFRPGGAKLGSPTDKPTSYSWVADSRHKQYAYVSEAGNSLQ